MRRIATVCLTAFLVLTLNASPVRSGTDLQYVYLVEAADCVSLPDLRVQTGFRLQGIEGLVTALHGVVGCSHVTARRPETGEVHLNLKIDRVDVERDVAILSAASLQGISGFEPHPTGIPDESTVLVVGHPQAIPGIWEMPLQVESHALKPLSLNLPPGLHKAVEARKSPAVWVRVLNLNGDLQPGHSGAPILDAAGKVLGVASGGLGDGTLGIGWAIPISEIDWKSPEKREQDLYDLAAYEPSLVFAHKDPDQPVPQPVIRSQGSGCIAQSLLFDLDRGDSRPADEDGDLFLEARTRVERYLNPNPWSTAQLVVMGNRDFERVTLAALRRETFGRYGVNASRDAQNELPAGTVLAVRTSEGRLAKLRINESQGDYVDFEWVTFALPSEGPSPVSPSVEPCGAEQQLLCGTGQLNGDAIHSFHIVTREDSELTISVSHSHNPAHGQVFLGARLLDKDGAALSDAYVPTAASPAGDTQVRVLLGSGRSRYLIVWMYESYKSEAFVCRRFDYRN